MSRLDFVIFGATGFTGKSAVEEAVRVAKKTGLRWGVAGRSQSKLESLMLNVSKKLGEDLSNIKVIIADVSDEKSLKEMCSQTKVVVNCCGPYRLYGEPVVKAAIENKAHHVDVTGETQFIESMQLKYDQQARDAGVYIITSCGFDSIPNDMGVVFLEQNFGGVVNSIESYVDMYVSPEHRAAAAKSGILHYGTWESLVHGIAHINEIPVIRKKLYPERLPTFKPKLSRRMVLHKRDGKWCLPFPGADESVVYRTQRTLYETEHKRPIQFKPYITFPSLIEALATMFGVILIFIMSKWSVTKQLLLDHPKLFSFGMATREGPTQEVMDNTYFRVKLIGEGWDREEIVDTKPPNKKVVARVSGVNAGYGATVIGLLYSAVTILKEQDKMPGKGGVITTGVAFRNTSLIKNLHENNFKFEVIDTVTDC